MRELLSAAFVFDPDFGIYLWVLATTGCRRGEGCALRWRDVDWERSELMFRRSIAIVKAAIRLTAVAANVGSLPSRRRRNIEQRAATLNDQLGRGREVPQGRAFHEFRVRTGRMLTSSE